MNKKLNLKPGNYYFYGIDDSEEFNDQVIKLERFRDNFLNRLPVQINSDWCWRTGSTNENALGLFYFSYNGIDPIDIGWCSKWSEPTKYCNIISSQDWTMLNPNKYIMVDDINELNNIETNINIKITVGETKCNENCIFYWSCSGDKESFNPSKALGKGISCENHNFEINKVKIIIDENDL